MFTALPIYRVLCSTTADFSIQDVINRPPPEEEGGESRKRPLEDLPSFFCWFSETEPSDDAAEVIKDEIWPNPLQFYFVSMVIAWSGPLYSRDPTLRIIAYSF